jgi:hypothetical protein
MSGKMTSGDLGNIARDIIPESQFSPGVSMGLYSHYDGAHNHPVNRALHMIAIPVGFSSLIVVWWHWVIALLLIPTAFALAWLGHLIEGNKPAFLTNPVHVFVAPLWLARRIFSLENEKK